MKSKVFKLFSCCLLSKGVERALILDNQRNTYYTIPLSMYNFLIENENRSIDSIKLLYKSDPNACSTIDEYFSFLLSNELIFLCEEQHTELFPSMSTSFDYHATISNAVLICRHFNKHLFNQILYQLAYLQCRSIELTFENNITANMLVEVLECCQEKEIDELILIIKKSNEITSSLILELKYDYHFLCCVIFFHSDYEDKRFFEVEDLVLVNTTKDLSLATSCGVVDSKYFTSTLLHYTESLHHNTCLNRKIAIDADGNIKNCPSMKESFGNIKDTTLEEAINKPGFKKYWNIKKDEITKCKDCEFRHVCTDCRAYLENPEDIYSAPLKCGYDPYTCEWEEWSTNPLKQKAIDYYGMDKDT